MRHTGGTIPAGATVPIPPDRPECCGKSTRSRSLRRGIADPLCASGTDLEPMLPALRRLEDSGRAWIQSDNLVAAPAACSDVTPAFAAGPGAAATSTPSIPPASSTPPASRPATDVASTSSCSAPGATAAHDDDRDLEDRARPRGESPFAREHQSLLWENASDPIRLLDGSSC